MERRRMLGEIVAAFRADGKAIFEAVEKAPWGEKVKAVEFEVRGRALKMYGRVAEVALLGCSGEARSRVRGARGECGRRMRMVRRINKTVVTVAGPLRFPRRYCTCDGCGRKRVPFDEQAGLDRSGVSAGARRLITWCGKAESFRAAAEGLKELADIRVSAETVREVTERTAREVEAAQGRQVFCGEEHRIDFGRKGKTSRAYLSADGTMVNTLEGWREVKMGAIYNQAKNGQHYLATLSEAGSFGMEMRRDAEAVGALGARQWVTIGDGAPWVWKMARETFPGSVEVVDYYHLREQGWACARGMYGEGSAAGAQWTARRLKEIRERGPQRLMESLRRSKRRRRREEEKEAVEALLGYVSERKERLRYPTFRRMGVDIGSGPVESACRHVIGHRLKGGGMRWTVAHAEAMARLRALSASTGAWNAFWRRQRPAA